MSERGAAIGVPHAGVLTEHERHRRLARQRDVELLLGDLDRRRMGLHRVQGLVEPEVRTAADSERESDDREQRPDQDPPQQAQRLTGLAGAVADTA